MVRIKKLKSNSIMKKMLFPMIVVMLVQAGLFAGTILWGGTIEQLNNNSFDILNERVINRKNYLQNEMIQRWSNLTETEETVNNKVAQVLAQENAALSDITANSPLAVEILEQTSADILYLIREKLRDRCVFDLKRAGSGRSIGGGYGEVRSLYPGRRPGDQP